MLGGCSVRSTGDVGRRKEIMGLVLCCREGEKNGGLDFGGEEGVVRVFTWCVPCECMMALEAGITGQVEGKHWGRRSLCSIGGGLIEKER